MKAAERAIVAQILESLLDEDQDDDVQMALLINQLAALDDKDLPIEELCQFLLTPAEGSDISGCSRNITLRPGRQGCIW